MRWCTSGIWRGCRWRSEAGELIDKGLQAQHSVQHIKIKDLQRSLTTDLGQNDTMGYSCFMLEYSDPSWYTKTPSCTSPRNTFLVTGVTASEYGFSKYCGG